MSHFEIYLLDDYVVDFDADAIAPQYVGKAYDFSSPIYIEASNSCFASSLPFVKQVAASQYCCATFLKGFGPVATHNCVGFVGFVGS